MRTEPFVFQNGRAAASIPELLSIIEDSSQQVFEEHVRESRNDFASWIDLSLHEKALADELRKTTDRLATIVALRNWLQAHPLEMHKHHFLEKGHQKEFLIGLLFGIILGIVIYRVVSLFL